MSQDLWAEVDEAVASALSGCASTASWRTYRGASQAALTSSLEAISGCAHVGLTCSGTAALECLLKACRLKPGDEVLLAGYDYPGNFAAVERVGARPALVDICESGWNLSPESLEATYTSDCKVLIASHLHGQLQPLSELHTWCRERQIWLIQDACQALGATIDRQALGCYGDATLFSFGGSKVISGGRGGAWATANDKLAQRARLAAGVGSGAYELSELQAAAIAAQLPYLSRITSYCRDYFARQHALLLEAECPVTAPWSDVISETAFYQAGWLTREPAKPKDEGTELHDHQADVPLSQAQQAAVQHAGVGSGFAGYHRRSARRCRSAVPLVHTQSVVARTFTIHHRAARMNMSLVEPVLTWLAAHLAR